MDSVKAKTFRDDLYFRINVFKIVRPPLSERREDIPLLVDHAIEHAFVLCRDDTIRLSRACRHWGNRQSLA